MSVMRQLWSDSGFLQAVNKMQGVDESNAAPAGSPALKSPVAKELDKIAVLSYEDDSTCAPDATNTDLFFCKDSAELTASDKKSLDAYAKAYLAPPDLLHMRKEKPTIVVDAYASKEGDDGYNKDLSKKRANAVADYLIQQGVPKDKIAVTGHGATDTFSKTDLSQNRRATIKPPPAPLPPEKKPDLSLGSKAPEPDISGIPIPEPPPADETVSLDAVKPELTKFLKKLGQSQGRKDGSVISTDKAWQADAKLHQGYSQGSIHTKQGATVHDGKLYNDAADLAGKIIADLPPEIPKKNFDDFKKLTPTDTPEDKKLLDKAKEKLKKKAEEVFTDFGIPKTWWPTIEDFVKNHTPDAIDKLPIDSKLKDLMKKAYDKLKDEDDKDK